MKRTLQLSQAELADVISDAFPDATSVRFDFDPPTGSPTDPGEGVTATLTLAPSAARPHRKEVI